MKLNAHLEYFSMRTEKTKRQSVKTKCHFARDIGEKCSNKQNHPVKIGSLFT